MADIDAIEERAKIKANEFYQYGMPQSYIWAGICFLIYGDLGMAERSFEFALKSEENKKFSKAIGYIMKNFWEIRTILFYPFWIDSLSEEMTKEELKNSILAHLSAGKLKVKSKYIEGIIEDSIVAIAYVYYVRLKG